MSDKKLPTQQEMQQLILIALAKHDLSKRNLTNIVRQHISKERMAGFQEVFDSAFNALKSQGQIVQKRSLVMTKAYAEQKRREAEQKKKKKR